MDTESIVETVQRALSPDFDMGWDLFLAGVPLAIAYAVFRRRFLPLAIGWIGMVLFVLFLPNAAYPLTDFLHFVLKVRQRPYLPSWAVAACVVPEYLLYIGISFLAYVWSVKFAGDYLRRIGRSRLVFPAELSLHALSAIGIYLGRALRLNSWDALTHPGRVMTAAASAFDRPKTALFTVGTALLVATTYYAVRFVIDALLRRPSPIATPDELSLLLEQAGFETGRTDDGRLFLRRRGLDWPPQRGIRRDRVQVSS
jgi:uncharacterized membrane protein